LPASQPPSVASPSLKSNLIAQPPEWNSAFETPDFKASSGPDEDSPANRQELVNRKLDENTTPALLYLDQNFGAIDKVGPKGTLDAKEIKHSTELSFTVSDEGASQIQNLARSPGDQLILGDTELDEQKGISQKDIQRRREDELITRYGESGFRWL